MLKFKNLLLFVCILYSVNSLSKNTERQNLEIVKILSDSYFLNIQVNESNIYIGSNDGLYKYDLKNGLELIDPDLKGYINSNIELEVLSNIRFTSKYFEILPKNLRSNKINSKTIKGIKMIISRGKLLIFKQKEYAYNNLPSTRTISENYIGTYEGIFKNKKRLGTHRYTNGFLREFKNKTFLCFDGLIEIKKDTVLTQRQFFMSLNEPKPTKVLDIAEYKKNQYLLFAENGLYLYNDVNNETTLFLKAEKGRYNYLTTEFNFNKPYYIYFYDKFNYYRYETSEQKLTKIRSFNNEILYLSKDKNGEMIKSFYALFKNRNLIHIFKGKRKTYQEALILKTTNLAHTIFSSKDYLFIMGNRGLDIYDFSYKKARTGFIKDELNKNAFLLKKDTIKVGGIHGTYTFPSNDINTNTVSSTPKISSNKIYIYLLILLTIAVIILLLVIFLKFRNKKNDNRLLIQKIDNYIEENLKEVSIEKLKTEFSLTNHNLYKLMGDQKPGSYIREKRFKLVKLLVKSNHTLDEIRDKTGFSISYLKKIV